MKASVNMKIVALLACTTCFIAPTTHADVDDSNYQELFESGMDELQSQNYPEAREELKKALGLVTTDLEKDMVNYSVGLSYLAEGVFDKAREELKKPLLSKDANYRSMARLKFGDIFNIEKEFGQSRSEYLKVLEDKSTDEGLKYQAQSKIGQSYLFEKKYIKAREEFAKLVLFEKTIPFAKTVVLSFTGQSYIAEGNFVEARQYLSKILTTNVDDLPLQVQHVLRTQKSLAQLLVAETYLKQKDYSRAKEEYNKVLQMDKVSPIHKTEAETQLKAIAELEDKEK